MVVPGIDPHEIHTIGPPRRRRTAVSTQQGQKAMQQFLQSVESALALAEHTEAWSWKEVETTEN
jgi:hypothetical protein